MTNETKNNLTAYKKRRYAKLLRDCKGMRYWPECSLVIGRSFIGDYADNLNMGVIREHEVIELLHTVHELNYKTTADERVKLRLLAGAVSLRLMNDGEFKKEVLWVERPVGATWNTLALTSRGFLVEKLDITSSVLALSLDDAEETVIAMVRDLYNTAAPNTFSTFDEKLEESRGFLYRAALRARAAHDKNHRSPDRQEHVKCMFAEARSKREAVLAMIERDKSSPYFDEERALRDLNAPILAFESWLKEGSST